MRLCILAVLFLWCAVTAAGCGKDAADNGTDAAVTPTMKAGEATPAPETTATPTPTASVMSAYEKFGRDDVYRYPIAELTEEFDVCGVECGGDYMLVWISKPGKWNEETGEFGNSTSRFVLCAPALGTVTYCLEPKFRVGESMVLADGTVLLMDSETAEVHVYDNTMKELRSYPTGGDTHVQPFRMLEDGTVLTVYYQEGRIVATDVMGGTRATITYDPNLVMAMYNGDDGLNWYFTAFETAGTTHVLRARKDNGTAELYEGKDALGSVFENYSSLTSGTTQVSMLSSTWFFHKAYDVANGVAFPKTLSHEAIEFFESGKMCVSASVGDGSNELVREYRVYDVDGMTVSAGLRDSEFAGAGVRARSMVSGSFLVFDAIEAGGKKELLLWDTAAHTEQVTGVCDVSAASLEKALSGLCEEMAKKGFSFTPDTVKCDGSLESVGEMLLEIDFINAFLLASKSNPELFAAKDGKTIHPENMENNGEGGHYTFQPHVFSEFYLKEQGENRRQAMFNYVDALRAGEDRFKCSDEETMLWCFGRNGYFFSLVGPIYTHPGEFRDGWGEICYDIPKEEYLVKQQEFETMICDILNDALRDDYSDIEKALALYEYITDNYTYDYEMLEHCLDWMDKQSGYRCLMEKTGICNEFAKLYQFLLLQVGVKAEESGGSPLRYGEDSHAWVYVELDGVGYLIDPTWGLTGNREPDLAYFLFTDEKREKRDGFEAASFSIGSCPTYESRKKYSFDAKDERYSELWDGRYIAMDTAENCIYYWDFGRNIRRFDYGE